MDVIITPNVNFDITALGMIMNPAYELIMSRQCLYRLTTVSKLLTWISKKVSRKDGRSSSLVPIFRIYLDIFRLKLYNNLFIKIKLTIDIETMYFAYEINNFSLFTIYTCHNIEPFFTSY